MALSRTVTTAAIAIGDASITLLAATGVAPGATIQVDAEFMQVQTSYVSGLIVPVLRGRHGSASVAHASGAGATIGLSVDFADPPAQSAASVNLPANRVKEIRSVSANGLIANPKPGTDLVVVLAGAALTTLTLGNPGKDNDGDVIIIVGAAVAAHVITYTGGFGGVAANDVVTFAAGAGGFMAVACNERWIALGGVVPA